MLLSTCTNQHLIPQKEGFEYREWNSKTSRFIRIWLPLFAHLGLSLFVAFALAFWIDGYMALAYSWQPRKQLDSSYVFRVSDVTTLLSAAVTLTEFVGRLWTGILAWRCAFILFETVGLSIEHLQTVTSFGIFPWKRPYKQEWAVVAVLLLILPQAFIRPLLSGSINWNFAIGYATAIQLPKIPASSTSPVWGYYIEGSLRLRTPIKALGILATLWSADDLQISKGETAAAALGGATCRRFMPNSWPVNSTLINATVPCIQIHSITWPAQAAPDDLKSYEDEFNNSTNPLFDPGLAGSAVLLNATKPTWYPVPNVTNTFPAQTKWSDSATVVLYITQQFSSCSSSNTTIFGDPSYLSSHLPSNNPFDVWKSSDGSRTCFAYGIVNFTAGVVRAPESNFVSPRVVEYNPLAPRDGPPPTQEEVAAAIGPSVWTEVALSLMPTVMTQISVANSSQLPTWENVDNYTATLIRQAYFAAWNALNSDFPEAEPDGETLIVHPAQPRLQASVSLARVFAWLVITLFIPATGIILGCVHKRYCERKMIQGTVSLLFTDAFSVPKKDEEKRSNLFLKGDTDPKLKFQR